MAQLQVVAKLSKGSNPWTEHYSAVMAEVPDPQDPATQLNTHFLDTLVSADQIYICGEAGSHCVKASTEHIADYLEARQGRAALARLVLLTDCMSPVSGFEAQQRDFLAAMQARGARLATSNDILPEWQANQAA